MVRCPRGHPLKLDAKGNINYNCVRCGYKEPEKEELIEEPKEKKKIKGGKR